MDVKKITKKVKIDKVLPRKIVNKMKTTNKDDWKKYYSNLSQNVNSIIRNIVKKNVHRGIKGIL